MRQIKGYKNARRNYDAAKKALDVAKKSGDAAAVALANEARAAAAAVCRALVIAASERDCVVYAGRK